MFAVVRHKLQELYQQRDPAAQRAADVALQEFQKTDSAWRICLELLHDADVAAQYFAAQTLCRKVEQVAQGYEEGVKVDLRELAPILLQHLASQSLSQQSKQQLVLALAVIVIQLCSNACPTAVADIIALASSQPNVAWCVLLAIPEQLYAVVHTNVKADRRTEALLSSAHLLTAAALQLVPTYGDGTVTGTLADSAFSLSMQTLSQWCKVLGMPLAEHDGLAKRLVEWLQGPAGHTEAVMDLVLALLRHSPGAFILYDDDQKPAASMDIVLPVVVHAMHGLLPSMERAAANPPVALHVGDARLLLQWAEVALTLVEAYTQVLWIDKVASDALVRFIAASFALHPNVAQSVFEFWAFIKDVNVDGLLPDGVLPGLLKQLTPSCISSLARFARLDSPYSKNPSDLPQLRKALQEIIVDMYCIAAGTPEAQAILMSLCEYLQACEARKDWVGVEVAWFAFNGIAEILVDKPQIPEVFHTVLQSVFRAEVQTEEQCGRAATLLRTCGPHFERNLQPLLVHAVRWLVAMISRVPLEASDALLEICCYAGQHLLPHVGEFVTVVKSVVPSVPAVVDAALHGALIGIIRGLDGDQAVSAFVQICEGAITALREGVDIAQEIGRLQFHRYACRLLRCALVMEEAGAGQDTEPGQPSPGARVAANAWAKVLLAIWPSLAPTCQRLLCAAPVSRDAVHGKSMYECSDVAVQINTLALLRRSAKAARDAAVGGGDLAAGVVGVAVACSKRGCFAPLCAVAVLANDPVPSKAYIMPTLDQVCNAALAYITAGGAAVDVIPLLDLVANLASTIGDDVFCSSLLPPLRQLCISAVAATQHDLLKPTLVFLQRLIMSGTVDEGALNVQEIIQAVLLNFHTWPRSINGQMFKLFTAFIERHSAIFLSMATSSTVPCIACLPPPQQDIARSAFRTLRGPQFEAFLSDIGSFARRGSSFDILMRNVRLGRGPL